MEGKGILEICGAHSSRENGLLSYSVLLKKCNTALLVMSHKQPGWSAWKQEELRPSESSLVLTQQGHSKRRGREGVMLFFSLKALLCGSVFILL